MGEQLFFVVELDVKPSQLDDLRAVASEMVGLAKDNEPGTLNYEYFFNAEAGVCHIYERYASPAALEVHSASFPQELQERGQAFRPLRLSAYGTLPSALRAQRVDPIEKAVPGFTASFFEPVTGFAR